MPLGVDERPLLASASADTAVISSPSASLLPIQAPSSGVGAAGSLPVAGTINQRLRKKSSINYDTEWVNADWFNVRDYGAYGNGSHDDTAAIQNCVDAALAKTDDGNAADSRNRRCVVFFPVGRYKITAAIEVPADSQVHIYFRGLGQLASVIQQYTSGEDGFSIDMSHVGWEGTRYASTTYHCGICDLGFQAMAEYCGVAVNVTYTGSGGEPEGSSHQVPGVSLQNVGVFSTYQEITGWWSGGFDLEGAWNANISGCFLAGETRDTHPSVTGPDFVVGDTYLITATGGTSFTTIGASANTVGTYFVATGTGTGITGTAYRLYSGTAIKLRRLMCNVEITNTQANFWSLGLNWDCVSYINPTTNKGKNTEGIHCSNVYMVSVGRGIWLQGNPNQVAAPRGSYFTMTNSHIDARGGPAAHFDYWQGVHFVSNLLIASDSIGTWDAIYAHRLKQSVISNNVFAICVNGVQLADTSLGNIIADNIGESCSNSLVLMGSSTTVNTVRGNRMNDGSNPVIYDLNSASLSNQIEGVIGTSAPYNPGSIGTNDSRWVDISVTGAEIGQCWVAVPPYGTDSLTVSTQVVASGTVRVVLSNVWYAARTIGSIVTAGSFVVGQTYTIVTVGTTTFTSIGASSNTVGVEFVATGAGSGSGTAGLGAAWKVRRIY